MSNSRSNSGRGRTGLPDRVRDDVPSGASSGTPTARPSNAPTGASAVSEDCVGFRYSWPCGHQQNLLSDGNGCLLADDAALINHVHFTVDLGDDGFPCPICPREEMPPPVYYPPVAEMPGRTRIDDLQWGFDRMAHDRHFQQLQAEVAAGTLVPEPVDPWRIEDPPEAEDLWRQIVALGMRLVEMRREPNGPGSGPTALVAAQVAPPLPQSRALAPQAMGPGVQAMAPLMPQGHPAHAHGPARRRSSNNSTLNPVTAFRGEFVPGQTWAANRLSRRQAARARAEWSLAHYQHGPWQIQSPLSQSMAPSQAPPAPIQTRGLLTRPAHQLTRMQQVITADDLEIAAGGADASGEAMAVGESGKGRRSTVVPEPGVGEVREGEDLYGVSD